MALVAGTDRFIAVVEPGAKRFSPLGVVDFTPLIGAEYGTVFEHAGKRFAVVEPSILDLLSGLERKPQIILPKDAAQILFNCDIRSGRRVVEAGLGSGAFTTALAWAVAPDGKVHSYEKREDFYEVGKRNLQRNGLLDLVDAKLGDVTQGIAERDVDAVILDMPDPENAVANASHALRSGGYFAAYTPLIQQAENVVVALRKSGFSDVRTMETLQREMEIGERGSRPSFEMLGHTAYLTFARRL